MEKAEDTQFPLQEKKKTRGCHHFLFFNLLFGNRDIQFSAAFYRQNIWARGGFGVKWTGDRSLPFWEAQKQRGSDCSPSLILTECTSTKCLVRYNQRLAQALLPSFAHPLKQITKLVPRALQTWVWCPGKPWAGSCVCTLSCKRTGPKPQAALGFVMTR